MHCVHPLLLVSALVILEFTLNLFGIHLQDWIPRERETTATLGYGIFRSYGFSSEPGTLSYFIVVIGAFDLRNDKNLFNLWYYIYTTALLCTFSVTGIFLWTLFTVYRSKKSLIFIGLILYTVVSKFRDSDVARGLYMKFTLDSNSVSADDRVSSFEFAFKLVSENILGSGMGYLSSIGMQSPKNFFLFFLVENGIINFLFLSIIVVFLFFQISRVNRIYFILALLNLMFISQIQYLYSLFVVFYLLKFEKKNLRLLSSTR